MFRRAALTLFLGISVAGLGFIPQKTFAQQAPSYRLEKINFVGSSRYSQDQLLAASGLRIGAAVSAQGFQDAATRLSQSGAFSEVKYRFNGAEAEYQLIDNPQFVPCTFENIVWMNDSELIAALRQKLPLFTGEVPLNGDLSNQVGQGIESVLKEKGIDASISVLPAANLNGPVKAMAYAAVTPRVEISQIEFRDASPVRIPTLEKATAALIGTEYRQSMLQDFASNQLRPIYLNQGYLHVDFGTAEAVPVATSAALAKVKITVPVREGAVYRFSAL
jgi:outer membrane protein assembly factor BamA